MAAPALAQAPAPPAADPAAVVRAIAAARPDPAKAVALTRVRLDVGPASLELTGTLIPAVADGLNPVELVFLGQGRIKMAAPDEIEAGQLELFTGAPRLDEAFTEAVLVLGPDPAVTALLRKPLAQPEAATRERAQALWSEWRKKREREIFEVDQAILVDALHDPLASGYFGAWFSGGELGSFLYFVAADEQGTGTSPRCWGPTAGTRVPVSSTGRATRRPSTGPRASSWWPRAARRPKVRSRTAPAGSGASSTCRHWASPSRSATSTCNRR